jgi:hypothetical protein
MVFIKKGDIMKYEFKKIDSDTTELRYKDKVFPIKKDIDLEKRIQEAIPRAKILMNSELAKVGKTKDDLIIVRKDGDKTYYDNRNAMEVEEQYQSVVIMQVYDEILQKYCNMTLAELMTDIGLDTQNETKENEKFGVDLTQALMGREVSKFPSKQEKEIV